MTTVQDVLTLWDSSLELPHIGHVLDVFQKCRDTKSLSHAKLTHLHLCNYGLEGHAAIGGRLVPLFVECGDLSQSEQIFKRLRSPNEHCWTSLMQGLANQGRMGESFTLFNSMQDSCVLASKYTFITLLKAAIKLQSLEKAYQTHFNIILEGFESDEFVGSSLVDVYMKLGSIEEAQDVFDELPTQGVVSWTSLMTGLAEVGLGTEVLKCLDKMQMEGIFPDAFTLVSSLKACSSIGSLQKGRRLHNDSVKMGFDMDTFLGNSLVDMYAKCSSLTEASFVFENLHARDIVSWNSIISGYAEYGSFSDVLYYVEWLWQDGIVPDSVTFTSVFKSLHGESEAIDQYKQLHVQIIKLGLDHDLYIGNCLIDAYVGCGMIEEAELIFDELPFKGVISWTILIDGCAENGLSQKSLDLLEQMQSDGTPPNAFTYICSLKACGTIRDAAKVQELHAEIVREGYERDPVLSSMLMDTYIKCGALLESEEIFNDMPVHDVVSWTTLIAGYVENGHYREALSSLENMEKDGVPLNCVTYLCAVKACASRGDLGKGQDLHSEIAKKGLENDLVVGNSLVDMYAKCSQAAAAQAVFDNLPVRNVVSWTALMSSYASSGHTEKALDCFQEMQLQGVSLDEATWNAIIGAYADESNHGKACKLYRQMQEQAILPNEMTFLCILKACGNAGALEAGKTIHAQFSSAIFEFSGVFLSNALLDLYCKSGSMDCAHKLFNEMPTRDVVPWNTLIAGYARQGSSERVLKLFESMTKQGIKPDSITFLIVLSACNHAGFVEKGEELFHSMKEDYNILPTDMHCNIIVDLFGRAGQFSKASKVLDEFSVQPNFVTISTVLGACQTVGYMDIGRQTFDFAMSLDNKETGAFILMSNMYAGFGADNDV